MRNSDIKYGLFLNGSEEAARNADLEPQQYLLMLALRGLPVGREPSIRELAERMQLRHHSVVELVDRLEKRQILRRERSRDGPPPGDFASDSARRKDSHTGSPSSGFRSFARPRRRWSAR